MKLDDVIQQPGQRERSLRDSIFGSLHVSVPGEILSYDPVKRTAVIQPVIRNWNSNEKSPILQDVPVCFPGGSSIGISFPLEKGDECIVIFSDVCIDNWFQNGGVSNRLSFRMHDLSDGFALVGIRSLKYKANNPPNTVNMFGMFYVDSDGYVCQREKGDDSW